MSWKILVWICSICRLRMFLFSSKIRWGRTNTSIIIMKFIVHAERASNKWYSYIFFNHWCPWPSDGSQISNLFAHLIFGSVHVRVFQLLAIDDPRFIVAASPVSRLKGKRMREFIVCHSKIRSCYRGAKLTYVKHPFKFTSFKWF